MRFAIDEENNHKFDPIFCKLIVESQFNNLYDLAISKNSIGEKGCQYLSQGCWEQLSYLSLKTVKSNTEVVSICRK